MLTTTSQTLADLGFSKAIPTDLSHEISGVVRGLGVYYQGKCIVGEGMGIGGPLALSSNNRAIFPLDEEELASGRRLVKRFYMNGISDKYIGRGPAEFPYRWIRTRLAPLYMRSSRFRPLFSFLMAARTVLGIRSHYRRTGGAGYVDVAYACDRDRVRVEVDATQLKADRFLVANELDGRLFKHMSIGDSNQPHRIPPWLEVIDGRDVRLVAPSLGLGFRMRHLDACRMFVGREVMGNRLNWAGCSYMAKPGATSFSYEVVFEKNE